MTYAQEKITILHMQGEQKAQYSKKRGQISVVLGAYGLLRGPRDFWVFLCMSCIYAKKDYAYCQESKPSP